MIIPGHWIDDHWHFFSSKFAFKRFYTPHTADDGAVLLKDVILDGGIAGSMKSITKDNASDMIAGMRRLRADLNSVSGGSFNGDDGFYVKYMEHVINLAVKECLSQVHSKIVLIWKLVGAMRSFDKRCDLFETVKKELNVSCELPNMDTETKWSSTFVLISRAFKARLVLNAVVNQLEDLADYEILEMEWRLADKV